MTPTDSSPRFQLRSHPGDLQVLVDLGPNSLNASAEPAFLYSQIKEVHLSFVPGSEYSDPHYLCQIRGSGKRLLLRADELDNSACLQYLGFVSALHHTLSATGSRAFFRTGMRSAWGYCGIMGGFALIFILLELAVIYAVATRGKVMVGLISIVVIALIGWVLLRFFALILGPETYDPQNIPERLLPHRHPSSHAADM